MNLLPLEKKIQIRNEFRMRFVIAILFFLFIFLISTIILLLPIYGVLDLRQKSLANSLAVYTEPGNDEPSARTVVTDTNMKLGILEKGKKERYIHRDIFGAVINNKGPIKITGLVYQKNAVGSSVVRVSGIAGTRSELLSFVTRLERDPLFIEVNAPVSQFVKERDIEFSIEMNI